MLNNWLWCGLRIASLAQPGQTLALGFNCRFGNEIRTGIPSRTLILRGKESKPPCMISIHKQGSAGKIFEEKLSRRKLKNKLTPQTPFSLYIWLGCSSCCIWAELSFTDDGVRKPEQGNLSPIHIYREREKKASLRTSTCTAHEGSGKERVVDASVRRSFPTP